ncbi:MAG: hypothetical protein NTW87_30665, partial [Planctomycetota bacterium]|nr:hypothetical protein [Planctomycetota bacterium]
HEAAADLDGAGVTAGVRAQTVNLLETIEALEYGSPAALDGATLVATAENLIPQLHRELDAKR